MCYRATAERFAEQLLKDMDTELKSKQSRISGHISSFSLYQTRWNSCKFQGNRWKKKKRSVGCDEWVNNGKNWSFGTNISGACSELIGNKQAWDDTYIYDDWEFPHPTQYVVPYTCRIKVKTLFINLFKGVLPSGWPNGPNIHLKVLREFVSTRYSSELCWRPPPPFKPEKPRA